MMRTDDFDVSLQFSQPIWQIVHMVAILAIVAAGSYLAYPALAPVFSANPYLNGVILTVFFLGVVACFWQVTQLFSSVVWIERFAQDRENQKITRPPRLLATLAGLLGKRMIGHQISTSSAQSILDSVTARMEEARDITRYVINTLIFLGLLGTFYGLATTVPAVIDTIRSLDPGQDEQGVNVFARLIGGLEKQLAGMGTAFASSLLGLAGSLVVGLLELFAGHGQNRFARELEEWLSSITLIGVIEDETQGTNASGGGRDGLIPTLENMNSQFTHLRGMIARAETARAESDTQLNTLTEAMRTMSEQIAATNAAVVALERVAESQQTIARALREAGATGGGGDTESRMRLQSIEVQLLKLFEEIAAGRQTTALAGLRTDIKALSQALKAVNRTLQDGTSGKA